MNKHDVENLREFYYKTRTKAHYYNAELLFSCYTIAAGIAFVGVYFA